MNLKSLLISSFFIRSILVISVFLLIFISSVSYKHTTALKESTGLLVQSYKIQIKLEQLFSTIKDAETGQRGYIISRDSDFLEPYIKARHNIEQPFVDLKHLTSNNVEQYHNLDSLQDLVNLRFTLLSTSLKLVSEQDENRTLLAENLLKGKQIMDKIRKEINRMTELENFYFEQHEKKYTDELDLTPLSTLFLILFSLLVFVLSFLKISRDLQVLKKSYADLRLSTEAFKHAEEIGKFSSWQWHIDSNEFFFSDNQYGLLGLEPQSFKPSMQNFIKYVHPDDRQVLEKSIQKALIDNKLTDVFFRIIRKDGEVRYFKSFARLTDFLEKSVFIGINSDITDHHLSKIALEERNKELEQSNNELASFNHIASHDLQEPLRKIQTFISRILEKESPQLSDTSKEYFSRIQLSVKRMRNLINDLLLFSRIGETEKTFQKTDLNMLLENAKQELVTDIEEKKAILESTTLPVMNVIPFQIQQLFVNLIGNSLKYSRPGVPPRIRIDSEKVKTSENPLSTPGSYYRITITDNGQGFEEKYAGSIFLLFYRLNPKTSSIGSGVGLSICKKIAENHNGFITVHSTPGAGSAFSVFLPSES